MRAVIAAAQRTSRAKISNVVSRTAHAAATIVSQRP